MKVHHVVERMNSIGGPAYTVRRMADTLARLGADVTVHSLSAPPDWKGRAAIRTYRHSRSVLGLTSSPSLRQALELAGANPGIVHSNTIWSLPNFYSSRAAQRSKLRHILTPDGTLDPWALRHHAYRKKLFWHLAQKRVLEEAHCLHAITEQEHGYMRMLGLKTPVAIVPWGVSLPDLPNQPLANDGARRKLLYLARVHPKKGVDLLLRAWAAVQHRFPDWELDVVGPDDGGYLPKMRALAEGLRLERATLHGAVSADVRDAFYQRASLYILPTHADSWGVTIADALAHGIPAIVGRAAPWPGLISHQCGWWVDAEPQAIAAALVEAMSLPSSKLRDMGARGRLLVEGFGWERVSEMMMGVYRWMLGQGPQPGWVRLD